MFHMKHSDDFLLMFHVKHYLTGDTVNVACHLLICFMWNIYGKNKIQITHKQFWLKHLHILLKPWHHFYVLCMAHYIFKLGNVSCETSSQNNKDIAILIKAVGLTLNISIQINNMRKVLYHELKCFTWNIFCAITPIHFKHTRQCFMWNIMINIPIL